MPDDGEMLDLSELSDVQLVTLLWAIGDKLDSDAVRGMADTCLLELIEGEADGGDWT